ncbi:prolipoprotein diacylglyceryl transferase [Oscillochloris sp. ZM17-4]|uniref:prolipoprotein diacylglyceryl transferase family protein n=1 Tax=Oscillochloris sp. ZM17-4 TaxID=2866714 RepID=UPI001C733729|nr:prolipoprotein diacylglyceryl transferase family protein [Oscillochloris sp. ZM17-4]MBX0329629.1 prolipoprotein diacylglyceryl transferase [Oscillochloris sp. ZM17-4]
MLPVIQVGRLALNAPGLALLLGLWLALWLAEREAGRLGLRGDSLSAALLAGLAAGLAAARLAFAARAPGAYMADPLALLSPNLSAFDPLWGLLAGMAVALLDMRRRGLALLPALDALAPALALMALALALAQLAGGDAYGAPARLPWSVYLWEEWRHPTQAYAALAALASLGLWRVSRAAPLGPGARLALVAGGLAAGQVLVEGFRGDSALAAGGLRVGQVVALLVLASALFFLRPGVKDEGE